jgi:ubiquinone/menaquinone biosynthesis C-methylase UbiE
MTLMITLFKYRCSCGNTDFLQLNATTARCNSCGEVYPLSPTGVIAFNQEMTEQNAYFDELYRAGHSHAKNKFQEDYAGAFNNSRERVEPYLKSAGLGIMEQPIENLSILDAACGSGWVTAGLLQNKNILNCRFHAFDISPDGPEMLARFERSIQSSNRLEISVQNAEAMTFGDATFDVIIGSSILHHFDAFESFLSDCRRILKPGGVAVFGEPFAIGYGLSAAALLIAQRQLGTNYSLVEKNYNDIAFRNKSPRELLKKLVDKHLFFQSTFIPLAQQIGFSSVNFILPAPRQYYRDHFINDLLHERGIKDVHLAEQANNIYRIIFDIFDTDSFTHSLGAFVHVVLKH